MSVVTINFKAISKRRRILIFATFVYLDDQNIKYIRLKVKLSVDKILTELEKYRYVSCFVVEFLVVNWAVISTSQVI